MSGKSVWLSSTPFSCGGLPDSANAVSTTALVTFGWTVAEESNGLALGGLYSLAVSLVFFLAILCLIAVIGLSVYADEVGKPGGAVESSITALWHLLTTLVGGIIGLLTGPGIANIRQN